MGIGKAIATAAASGVVGGAESQLEKLRREAQEAKEMRMATFKQEGAESLQKGDIEARKEAAGLLAGARAKEFGTEIGFKEKQLASTEALTRAQIASTESIKAAQFNLQNTIAELKEKGLGDRQAVAEANKLKIAADKIAADSKDLATRIQGQKDLSYQGYEQDVEAGKLLIEAKTQSVDDARDNLLAQLKNSEGYKKAPPKAQEFMEVFTAVNGKIPEQGGTVSMGFGAEGKDLKGPTAAQIEGALTELSQDPVVENMSPHARYQYAVMEATKAANPTADVGWGSENIPNEKVVKAATDLINGDMKPGDFMMYSPASQSKIFKAMGELEEDTQEPAGTLVGPPRAAISTPVAGKERPAAIPGRGLIQGIEGLLNPSYNPQEVISEKQRQSATYPSL